MQGSCAVCTLLRRTTETTVFLSTKRPKGHGCPAGKGWATPSSLQHYLTILFLEYGRLFGAVDAFITVIVQLPGRSIVAGERCFSVQIGFKTSLRRAGGDEERQRPRLCGSLDFLLNQPFSGFRHFFTHVYAKHGPCIKCLAKRLLLEIELYYWYTSRARNRVGAIRNIHTVWPCAPYQYESIHLHTSHPRLYHIFPHPSEKLKQRPNPRLSHLLWSFRARCMVSHRSPWCLLLLPFPEPRGHWMLYSPRLWR